MGESNLMQHVKAAIDLWRVQQSMGVNKAGNTRKGAAMRGLLRQFRRTKLDRQKNQYPDNALDR